MKSESSWAAVMEMMRKIVVDRCSGEIERSKAKADGGRLYTEAPAKTKYVPSPP